MLRNAPRSIVALAAVTLSLSACGGSGGTPGMPATSSNASAASPVPMTAGRSTAQAAAVQTASVAAAQSATADMSEPDPPSILDTLTKSTTIGSTVDPVTGDQNPYGLDIAPITSGKINKGDLVVCDFNDSANVQGTGNSIIALAPVAGSSPRHIVTSGKLLGCTENVQTSDGNLWVTAFVAPDVVELTSAGTILQTLSGTSYPGPFGITLAQRDRDNDADDRVLYESDAKSGAIIRLTFSSYGSVRSEIIATGFAVNGGAPGTELGPGGLQYEARRDRLYIVDGANNTLVRFDNVSRIPAYGIKVAPNGSSFSGPSANDARLVFSGSPLNAPISSALFSNGNIVIGNTGNPNGVNLMVEITPRGHVAATKNVDTGAAGAIFGMIADGYDGYTKLYFNDDNANAVVELSKP
jgi:hypothetical protein